MKIFLIHNQFFVDYGLIVLAPLCGCQYNFEIFFRNFYFLKFFNIFWNLIVTVLQELPMRSCKGVSRILE